MSGGLGWLQLAGVLLGSGLLVLLYVLVVRMCGDQRLDAKALLLFGLLRILPRNGENQDPSFNEGADPDPNTGSSRKDA